MKHTALLLLGLCLAGLVLADDEKAARDPQALEILQKADGAIKAVDSVSYDCKSTPTGVATNFVQAAEGSIVMSGWNGGLPQKFYSKVKTNNAEGTAIEIEGGGDGDMFFIIDHGTKKGYEDMDPGVFGSTGSSLQALAMLEFVHEAPFDDELGAEEVQLLGEEKVGDEECYKVLVVYSGGRGKSTWLFSKKDLLPRGRIQIFSTPQGEGSIERYITNLDTSPALTASRFRMKLPEGYEQIDDFAP
jgi:outer membrane lipoprotein-sorting protein